MSNDSKLYKIIRFYQDDRRTRVMRKNLTLAQAQAHCDDPEASSKTASKACNGNPQAIERWHDKQKHWFDGYTEQ